MQLHDGSVFEGELVEKVPEDHATLKLPTGDIRRLEWQTIASSNHVQPTTPQTWPQNVVPLVTPLPFAPPTLLAHVTVTSDSAGPVSLDFQRN